MGFFFALSNTTDLSVSYNAIYMEYLYSSTLPLFYSFTCYIRYTNGILPVKNKDYFLPKDLLLLHSVCEVQCIAITSLLRRASSDTYSV